MKLKAQWTKELEKDLFIYHGIGNPEVEREYRNFKRMVPLFEHHGYKIEQVPDAKAFSKDKYTPIYKIHRPEWDFVYMTKEMLMRKLIELCPEYLYLLEPE